MERVRRRSLTRTIINIQRALYRSDNVFAGYPLTEKVKDTWREQLVDYTSVKFSEKISIHLVGDHKAFEYIKDTKKITNFRSLRCDTVFEKSKLDLYQPI